MGAVQCCDTFMTNDSGILQKIKIYKTIDVGKSYFYFPDLLLGEGAFGKVFFGGKKIGEAYQDEEYAIKQIKLKANVKSKAQIKSQFDIVSKIDHKNIIKVYDFLESQDYCYIVQQKCDFNLQKLLQIQRKLKQKLDQNQCFYIICSIFQGFQVLNQNNIIHRDLKPQNVMIKKGILKVGDFGISKIYSESEQNRTYAGTPIYMPLEVMKGQKYTKKYDVWSLGCIFYQLFYKELPWQSIDRDQRIKLFQKYFSTKSITEIPQLGIKTTNTPHQVVEFLNKCLRIDAEYRCDWTQLLNLYREKTSYYLKNETQYSQSLGKIVLNYIIYEKQDNLRKQKSQDQQTKRTCKKVSVCLDSQHLVSLPISVPIKYQVYIVNLDLSHGAIKLSFSESDSITFRQLQSQIRKVYQIGKLIYLKFDRETFDLVNIISNVDDTLNIHNRQSELLFVYQIPQIQSNKNLYFVEFYFNKERCGFPIFLNLPKKNESKYERIVIEDAYERVTKKSYDEVVQSLIRYQAEKPYNKFCQRMMTVTFKRKIYLLSFKQNNDFEFTKTCNLYANGNRHI